MFILMNILYFLLISFCISETISEMVWDERVVVEEKKNIINGCQTVDVIARIDVNDLHLEFIAVTESKAFYRSINGPEYTSLYTIQLNTTNGEILGKTGLTVGEKKLYYAFQGIPYAEPPQRFELPVAKKNWTGVLDCTYDKSECVQGSDTVSGSEDCLFVNVYSTNLSSSNASVVVWIHGGGFKIGNASYVSYGPDYFLDEDVVYVSIQYRLGVFGFLSTGDLVSPGNLGFKDQALALEWVYNNIKYFGGNNKKITLFGQSAGAASVSLHLQSPKSRGYFNAAIMNSGNSLSLWSLCRGAVEFAFDIGSKFSIWNGDSSTLVRKLKSLNYETLQTLADSESSQFILKDPLAGLAYGAVKEPIHPTSFFTSNSDEELNKAEYMKNIPVMLGVTSNEASAIGEISTAIRLYLVGYDLDSRRLAPADLTDSPTKEKSAATLIKDKFFGDTPVSFQSDNLIKFISADQWVRPTVRFATDISKFQKDVFFYMFSYMGKLGGASERIYDGVGHTEDLNYLFRTSLDSDDEEDKIMRSRMVKLWSNFIKYNNPTPNPDPLLQNQIWAPVDNVPGNFKYFNINSTMEMRHNPYEDSLGLYNIIYNIYGKNLYDTY